MWREQRGEFALCKLFANGVSYVTSLERRCCCLSFYGERTHSPHQLGALRPANRSSHSSTSSATSTGRFQRSSTVSAVRSSVHVNRCLVSWSCLLQSKHVGVGWFIECNLCRYDSSSGDFFVRNCASVRLCLRIRVFSESCILSAGAFRREFTGLSRRYCLTVSVWIVLMLREISFV